MVGIVTSCEDGVISVGIKPDEKHCCKSVNLLGLSASSLKMAKCLMITSPDDSEDLMADFPEELSSLASISSNFSSRSGCRKRAASEEDPYGFYVDMEQAEEEEKTVLERSHSFSTSRGYFRETPEYVLEESLSSQVLWYETAGKRPRQPKEERDHYQKLWEQNFKNSHASCSVPDTQASGHVYRNTPYAQAVTKSYTCRECGSSAQITINIPKYRIVKEGFDAHAEYLVVIVIGGTHTFGVWKRYTDFEKLAASLVSPQPGQHFTNSLHSWQCLREKRRWYRCLDKEYLVLKCYMLQRFLQDLVFESLSPSVIREFLDISEAEKS
mmetsp:Transcript_12432/g.18330  ORF Transcript_12432/g.18330 Transcript_12432/m.18330 type:complete len:326 (-) Transcript_12432:247-1224(-)